MCNKKDKKVALTVEVDKELKDINFGIAEGGEIQQTNGTMQNRGNVFCPYCEQVSPVADLRKAGLSGVMGERMVAVIVQGKIGKEYRPIEDEDLISFRKASKIDVERPGELILPEINADDAEDNISNSTGIRVHLYGMKTWGSLFNDRQLVAIQTLVRFLHKVLEAMKVEIAEEDYRKAVGIYLGLWVSRVASFGASACIWASTSEIIKNPFGRQAIPMNWDYPEANPISDSSGSASTQLRYMLDVIKHESRVDPHQPAIIRCGDAIDVGSENYNSRVSLVVTDPPYFDAIAYSDLSDFFYVWLKRALIDVVPEVLITPLTPKGDESTALKHRHMGSVEKAEKHFRMKLTHAFARSRKLLDPNGIVIIMFAHQSTKAWTALIHAVFESGLTVHATWPIDTELTTALKASMSALSSSVTVACRPRIVGSASSFKDVRKEIEKVVKESVKRFWGYGFRGADLIVACYGPAVGVFGKYERVEKADGSPVEIPELLEMARKAARDAIAGEFKGDNLSTLYYVWTNLYGASEQAWDDARLVVQIGGDSDNPMEIARGQGIFVVEGSRCRLALLADRADRRGLGADLNPPLIDAFHKSMLLWKQEKRGDLVSYLAERGLMEDGPFWKLAQALFEVLPRDTEDWKLTNALLSERETLRMEGKPLVIREDRLFYPAEEK